MCGIAGIIANATDIEERLRRMSEAIAHRGPDDQDCQMWPARDSIQTGFAHRRLSIIDLSAAGRQPMTTSDGRFSIVYNGEIYNYLDLRHALEQSGVAFRTNTDTEVLLELYRAHGTACLDRLRGMFAFALRDNESGDVFVARDRLGIKPLYYYSEGGRFLFCSELLGLLASGLAPRVLDAVSLNSYLSFGAVQEPRTIIEGVRSLPPAHFMVVGAGGVVRETQCYWRLPAARHDIARDEAIATTRSLLEESVRLHLVADVPLGAFLSSGVDSASIVALMSKHASGRVKTFTVCFEEPEFSEDRLARKVAETHHTEHREIVLSDAEMLASLPDAISAIDQPTIDGINTWVISRAARRAGMTVALSGLGGDELFGGYPSFRRARKLEQYGAPVGWLNPASRRRLARIAAGVLGDSVPSQKAASVISAGADSLAAYASMRGLFSRTSRDSLINARVRGAAQPASDYELPPESLELVGDGEANGDVFNRISRYEMSLYMANMLLRDTDAMSMSSALEVRVPLLDHKLVEWVYSLPGAMKTGRHPKQLLIEAMGAELPAEIANRKKTGFALPFERWIRTSLKPFVSDALNDTEAVLSAGLNPAAVVNVVDRFARGSRSTSWSRVWGLAVLVDWSRRNKVSISE